MADELRIKEPPASILPASITYMNTAHATKGFWPMFEVNPTDLVYLDRKPSQDK